MTIFTKIKYSSAHFASFLLLILSANDARAQKVPVSGFSLYGIQPTIGTIIGGVASFFASILLGLGIIIAPVIGYRWLFKKGSASYTKRLAGYLKWILAILVILIILKGIISLVIGAVS